MFAKNSQNFERYAFVVYVCQKKRNWHKYASIGLIFYLDITSQSEKKMDMRVQIILPEIQEVRICAEKRDSIDIAFDHLVPEIN